MHDADLRPSRSAAVVTIMKNLSHRVIAGGALQDYLTDDADELWSGLVVDRHCILQVHLDFRACICVATRICMPPPPPIQEGPSLGRLSHAAIHPIGAVTGSSRL